jgi:hypothetical protein
MRRTVLLVGSIVLVGCGVQTTVSPPQTAQTPATPAVPPPVVVAPPSVVAPPPATERIVADTGVGAKGRDYGGGIITEPVRQYFRAPQMVVFDIQIPHAMNLYKASNDNKGPASHEEFMTHIIQANQLKLPKLIEGEKYVYDASTEQLMVERPAKKPGQ